MAKGQAERLMPLLEQVLADAGVQWSDLAGLGVGVGPGNFTGIRIAVSAARGLALGLGIPAVGVSMFEALALDQPRPLTALVDARRDMVYAQDFETGQTAAPRLIARSDLNNPWPLVETLPEATLAVHIARIAGDRIQEGGEIARPAPLYLRAADAAPASDPPPVILP